MKDKSLEALEYLSEMPLTYTVPAYFGNNRTGVEKYQRNGSATLLKVDGKQWALTNSHVIQGYRDALEEYPDLVFQLGNMKVDPLNLIISESSYYDLVVLDLSEYKVNEFATGGTKPTYFYEASDWPPIMVNEDDLLLMGGFPGKWRRENGKAHFRSFTFSQAGIEVKSVSEEVIVCTLDLEKCKHILSPAFEEHLSSIEDLTNDKLTEVIDWGGMSGGPVFLYQNSPNGLGMIYFVGIMQEFQKTWGLMRVVPASLITKNGYIKDEPPSF